MPKNSVRDYKNVMTRMGTEYVDMLDEICDANKRSRREIQEMLIAEAYEELAADPSARITPI